MNRKNLLFIMAAFLVVSFSACNSNTIGTNAKVETDADSVALSLGYSIGSNLSQQFSEVDAALIAQGIIDAYAGNENPLFSSPEEADSAIRSYMTKLSERKGIENAKAGEAFLAENAKKEGISVTESGLQYEVLVEGDGEKPAAEDKVKVHYHGTTIDGTVFDSSVDRGEPVEFPLNGVIKGWTEGVQLMNVGSKYKFYIPSDLAYGERGAGAQIGPNSTLVFEVELLEIVK